MLHHIDELGVRLVVVAFTPPESLVGYQRRQRLDHLLVLSDPDRRAYEAFGLGRGSVVRVWVDPRVWARYVRLVARGWRPEAAHQDTLQLGGDVLIDSDGHIEWIYRSRGPEDRPSLEQIRHAVDEQRADNSAGR